MLIEYYYQRNNYMGKKKKSNILANNWKTIALIVFALMIVVPLWLWNYNSSHAGTFGDKFGVVNALFSGLAFAGIIITIYLQMSELKLQRKELEETRNVFVEQSKIMKEQQAESSFFHLLDNHRKVVDSLAQSKTKHAGTGNLGSYKIPITEKVSGYEVIDSYMNSLYVYFDNYRLIIKSGRSTDIRHLGLDPLKLISNIPFGEYLYKEVLHIINFVLVYVKEEKRFFHLETLERSLSENEKWFLAIYTMHQYDTNTILSLPEINDIKDYYRFDNVGKLPHIRNIKIETFNVNNMELEIENLEVEEFRIFEIENSSLLASEPVEFKKTKNKYYLDFQHKLYEDNCAFKIAKQHRNTHELNYVLKISGKWRNDPIELFSELTKREHNNMDEVKIVFDNIQSIESESEDWNKIIDKL